MKNPISKAKNIYPRYIVASILALVGICLLLYPKTINLLYEYKITAEKEAFLKRTYAAYTYSNYSENNPGGSRDGDGDGNTDDARSGYGYVDNGDDIPAAFNPYEALYQFLDAENERLYNTGQDDLKDAFSYQTAGIDLSGFGLEDGCIGYLEIPSIKALMPIYLGANAQNMKNGAAHMTQTSYPIGGNNTNAVIAAHRGGTREMLRNIHKIKIGDEIIVVNFKEQLVYQAIEIKIILPTDISEVKIREGQDLITLLSCNPLGKNYQRYVVYCRRVKEQHP